MMVDENYIGVEDAANYLDIKVITLRKWIKNAEENGIPVHRIGKLWKFKKTELDEWVNTGRSAIPTKGGSHDEQ